jgi:hypothetical protein
MDVLYVRILIPNINKIIIEAGFSVAAGVIVESYDVAL